MLATIRRKLNWNHGEARDNNAIYSNSALLRLSFGFLEEILLWKTLCLSLFFIIVIHAIILTCVQRQISIFQFLICFLITILIMDAFECWLRFKHRTTFLKKISSVESPVLKTALFKVNQWIEKQWIDFIFIREKNHTKAFLVVNITFGLMFLLGKYINGYLLIYLCCMFLLMFNKVAPVLTKLFRDVVQDIESDTEIEGLMPEASDIDIKLLSIEPEKRSNIDEKQSLDYWKPDDIPIEEVSDSSENSSSIVTNFSMEKVKTLEKDNETSDSSADEYIPFDQQKEKLLPAIEVAEPTSSSWSNMSYSAFWSVTNAMTSIMQSEKTNKRNRVSSVDSSDGFEMIDQKDLN